MIIGISGKIGSGKDTVAGIIQELAPEMNWEVKRYAHKLKQIASMLTGIAIEDFEKQEVKASFLGPEWDEKSDQMTVRTFLQKLGTEAIRNNIHENAWVNALYADYEQAPQGFKEDRTGRYYSYGFPNWLITDCRFPNEAAAVKLRDGIVIRVERIDNPYPSSDHPSETSLDDFEFDVVILNEGGIDSLKRNVRCALEKRGIIPCNTANL